VNSSEQAGTAPVIALSPNRILRLLSEGEIEVEGMIPWSSNATLLVTVQDNELSTLGVYKPQRGERPLWDFPTGSLGKREVAAYLVCEELRWDLVPPTVLRQGPYGLGSVQFFVHSQEDAHFFTIQHDSNFADDLLRLAVYDIVANNADRKSGHCLVGHDGHLWAIDNALTFHAEHKLRTVIWDFADQPLPPDIVTSLRDLQVALDGTSGLLEALSLLLSGAELSALRRRVQALLQAGHLPKPGPGRVVPWPLV
jgi:uncharacterized repeat protein (TIGR03843 family)